jgi:hypothetical protein
MWEAQSAPKRVTKLRFSYEQMHKGRSSGRLKVFVQSELSPCYRAQIFSKSA